MSESRESVVTASVVDRDQAVEAWGGVSAAVEEIRRCLWCLRVIPADANPLKKHCDHRCRLLRHLAQKRAPRASPASPAREVREEALRIAREGARLAALRSRDRIATADDAIEYLKAEGHVSRELGSASGLIFRDGKWGRWGSPEMVQSSRPSNHGRRIQVWRLLYQPQHRRGETR